jgi:hypothetical protein
MKEGLLGGTLGVSARSESEEARLHVARWAGFDRDDKERLRCPMGYVRFGRKSGAPIHDVALEMHGK